METKEVLKKLKLDLNEAISLANDGLLKSERLHAIKNTVENELQKLAMSLDERSQLIVEKVIPKIHNLPKSGLLINADETRKELTPLLNLIQEFSARLPQDVDVKDLIEDEKRLVKKVKESIDPIKEGLFKFDELGSLCKEILNFINLKAKNNKLWQLRLRKFNDEYNRGLVNIDQDDYVSVSRTYTSKSGWDHFEPFVDFLFRFLNESKIIKRLEDDEMWVESRNEGKESHMFIGSKKGKGKKVHLIFSETGVMRIDKSDLPPSELLNSVESVLRTKDGKIIKSLFEFE